MTDQVYQIVKMLFPNLIIQRLHMFAIESDSKNNI